MSIRSCPKWHLFWFPSEQIQYDVTFDWSLVFLLFHQQINDQMYIYKYMMYVYKEMLSVRKNAERLVSYIERHVFLTIVKFWFGSVKRLTCHKTQPTNLGSAK